MQFVIWQNIISPLQSAFIRELASRNEVILAVEKTISDSRVKQGWSVPDTGKAKVIVLDNELIFKGILETTINHIHLFSGFTSYPILKRAFRVAIDRSQVGIIAESPIQFGWRQSIRYLLYRYFSKVYGNKLKFIFAMGSIGVNWYKQVGFDTRTIMKFQYFTELPAVSELRENCESKLSFVFIGQLIPRKAVSRLLKALAHFDNLDWHLHIIGDGYLKEELINLTNRCNLEHKVTFHGNMRNDLTMSFLEEKADFLILPSRFDGWGAVINEALSRGIKVITNDKCGASDLVKELAWGTVYNEHSFNSLVQALKTEIINFRRSSLSERKNIATIFQQKFSSKVVHEFEDHIRGHVDSR